MGSESNMMAAIYKETLSVDLNFVVRVLILGLCGWTQGCANQPDEHIHSLGIASLRARWDFPDSVTIYRVL